MNYRASSRSFINLTKWRLSWTARKTPRGPAPTHRHLSLPLPVAEFERTQLPYRCLRFVLLSSSEIGHKCSVAAARKAVELQPTAAGSHRWQVFVSIERGNGE